MTSLHRSKQDAKKLLRLARSGDAESARRIAAALASAGRRRTGVTLSDAQFTIARERGFPSWAALKHAIDSSSQPLDPQIVREWLVAAEHGDFPALKRLLAATPRLLDAQGQGPYWVGAFRALHYAVYRGHRKVIRWLLARGASAKPLDGDADWAPLHFAALPTKPDIVKLLLARGARIDVFTAAVTGDVRVVRRLLKNDPTLVASRGPDGATALHFAGSPAVARALLAAGADPLARDRFHNQTPVEWTSEKPQVAAVVAQAGPGIDIHLACAMGDLRRVRALVRRNPDAVNATVVEATKTMGVEGESALGIAARYGHERVVEFLLAHGASASTGPSPLTGAAEKGHRLIVKRLLEAGADPNAFGPQGHPPLHMASINGKLGIMRLLLARGARLDVRDKEHNGTPLGWAAYRNQKKAVALLKAHDRNAARVAQG
jgi:ankyrin repeat protein